MEPEFHVAVCDDLPEDREQISRVAAEALKSKGIPHSITCYENARALLADIQSGASFQLLLLDVLMDEMDGMTLAQALRDRGDQTMIVFISVSQEMARRGYLVKAQRYLVKPLDKAELLEALLYCHTQWQDKKEILLPTEKGQYRISFSDIQFVEALERGSRFVLADEAVETKLRISEVEAMLPRSGFVLCHRGYIVNLVHTKRISRYQFTMKSGAVVSISRLRYNEVRDEFMSFFRN